MKGKKVRLIGTIINKDVVNIFENQAELTQLKKNRIKVSNFEQKVKDYLNTIQNNVVNQITMKTDSDVKKYIFLVVCDDFIFNNQILKSYKFLAIQPKMMFSSNILNK